MMTDPVHLPSPRAPKKEAGMELTLYYAPDTCARVTMIALEEIGLPYEASLISFVRGDHRSDWFGAYNPRARVPTLIVDGAALTENPAILLWLADQFPAAKLLPLTKDALANARIHADLAWCASGLHPLVTRMRLPHFFCTGPDSGPNVRALAEAGIAAEFERIEAKLANGPWWYGDRWSIIDAYINWIWFRVVGCGFDASPYPLLRDHDRRLAERPSVRRTLDIHANASRTLADQGLAVNFDTIAPQASPGKAA